MDRLNLIYSFQFDNDFVLNKQVDSITSVQMQSEPQEFTVNDATILLSMEEVHIKMPTAPQASKTALTRFTYPSECRERLVSYKGDIVGQIKCEMQGSTVMSMDRH